MPTLSKPAYFLRKWRVRMKLATRFVPVGALPYDNIKHTTAMMAKLFGRAPFIPVLPNISETEAIHNRLFENIPGVIYKDKNLTLKIGPNYE